MTILVLVSLGAMLAAIGGLGSTPMRKSNGISPYIGVNWGQAARAPGPAPGSHTKKQAGADCAYYERDDQYRSCRHCGDSCVLICH